MEKVEKTKLTFTLDKKLKEDFEKHIDDNLLNKSRVIEFLIESYMKGIK